MQNNQLQNKNTQILRIENELDIEGRNNSQEYRIILHDIIEQKQPMEKLLELIRSDDLSQYSANLNTCLKILKAESENIKILESRALYGVSLTVMLATDFITRSGLLQNYSAGQGSLTGASTTLFASLLNSIKFYTRQKTAQLGIARNLMSEYEALLIKMLDKNSLSKSTKDHKTLARKIIAGKIKKELSEMQISADDAQNIVDEFKYSVMQTEPESYISILFSGIFTAGIYIMSNLRFNNDARKTQFVTTAALAISCTYMIHSEYSKFQDKSHKFKYTLMLTDIINDAILSSNVLSKQNSVSPIEAEQENFNQEINIINKGYMPNKVIPFLQEVSLQEENVQESIDMASNDKTIQDLELNIAPKKAASDQEEKNWQEVIDIERNDNAIKDSRLI